MLFYPVGFFVSSFWTVVNGTDVNDLTCKPQYQIQVDIENREYCDYRLLDVVQSYQHLLTPNLILLTQSKKFNIERLVTTLLNKLTKGTECDDTSGHEDPIIIYMEDDDDDANEKLLFSDDQKEGKIVNAVEFSIDCLLERANKSRTVHNNNMSKKNDLRVLNDDDEKYNKNNCVKCTDPRDCKRCDDRRRKLIQLFRLYVEVVKNKKNNQQKNGRRKKKKKKFRRLFLTFLHFSWTLESLT